MIFWLSQFLRAEGFVHDLLLGKLTEGGIDFGESFGLLTTGVYVPLAAVSPYVLAFYIVLSFLDDSGLMFCTKAGCPSLLEEMKVCDDCGEPSFSVRLGSCRNRSCRTFEVSEGPVADKDVVERDDDLARVIALWPQLPPHVRNAIRVLLDELEGT